MFHVKHDATGYRVPWGCPPVVPRGGGEGHHGHGPPMSQMAWPLRLLPLTVNRGAHVLRAGPVSLQRPRAVNHPGHADRRSRDEPPHATHQDAMTQHRTAPRSTKRPTRVADAATRGDDSHDPHASRGSRGSHGSGDHTAPVSRETTPHGLVLSFPPAPAPASASALTSTSTPTPATGSSGSPRPAG